MSADDISKDAIMRIIDANVNRCAEGLRVIEETARFYLDDTGLVREAKELRHKVRMTGERFQAPAMGARDSSSDVGSTFSTDSENMRSSILSVPKANFRRVEESLRVLEEYGKLLGAPLAESFKGMRFKVYSFEKEFLSKIASSRGMPSPPFLYPFVDRTYIGSGECGKAAAILADSGADLIQYRAKELSADEMMADMEEIMDSVRSSGVPVIVNDYPEVAVRSGAAGVHIGREDIDPVRARDIIGPARILGLTVNSPLELEKAHLDDIDYVAAGPVFGTRTKPELDPVGLGFISDMRNATSLPLVAIGGIDISNAESVLDAGADGLAVVSAVLNGDISRNCFTLRKMLDKKIEGPGS